MIILFLIMFEFIKRRTHCNVPLPSLTMVVIQVRQKKVPQMWGTFLVIPYSDFA